MLDGSKERVASGEESEAARPKGCFLTMTTKFGTVCCAHSPPLREAKDEMTKVLDSHDIILGDLNTTRGGLLSILRDTHLGVCRPSYLPSKTFESAGWPPCFDHILIRKKKSERVRLCSTQVLALPKVKKNPRGNIQRLEWCSDHVPVEADVFVQGIAGRFATWNVADPIYYAKMNSQNLDLAANIMSGFEHFDETQRQCEIRSVVDTLLSRNDLVALQEVPIDLSPVLRVDGIALGFEVDTASDASSLDTDGSKAAQLMLFCKIN